MGHYIRAVGKGSEESRLFFRHNFEFVFFLKGCLDRILSRLWWLRELNVRLLVLQRTKCRRHRGRRTPTTTRNGSEAVRNADRSPDPSQAAGVVRRADAERPKVAAVRRVAARVAARVAKPGVDPNVAAAVPSRRPRRRASGRIHERPTA